MRLPRDWCLKREQLVQGEVPRSKPPHSRHQPAGDDAQHPPLHDLRRIGHLPWMLGDRDLDRPEQADLYFSPGSLWAQDAHAGG